MKLYGYLIYFALSPSGKVYIGLTSQSLQTRIYHHHRHARLGKQWPLSQAIRKYGELLHWEIIITGLTKAEAVQIEKDLIKQLDTQKHGYNATSGGDGCFDISQEARIAHSESVKKWHQSHKALVCATNKFITNQPTTRRKMSNNMTDFYAKPENREIQSVKIRSYFLSTINRDQSAVNKGGRPFRCIETNDHFINISRAAEQFKGDAKNLQAHLKGRRRSFRGYHFEYITVAL